MQLELTSHHSLMLLLIILHSGNSQLRMCRSIVKRPFINDKMKSININIVQLGGGYPGSVGCNDVIPHAKWHAQTAAALADMTRLMDFVLALEKKHTA